MNAPFVHFGLPYNHAETFNDCVFILCSHAENSMIVFSLCAIMLKDLIFVFFIMCNYAETFDDCVSIMCNHAETFDHCVFYYVQSC